MDVRKVEKCKTKNAGQLKEAVQGPLICTIKFMVCWVNFAASAGHTVAALLPG
jgi:hypothetical protein